MMTLHPVKEAFSHRSSAVFFPLAIPKQTPHVEGI
jgi:hypothetical protein